MDDDGKWKPEKDGTGKYAFGSEYPVYIYSKRVDDYLLGKRTSAIVDVGGGDDGDMDNMLTGNI